METLHLLKKGRTFVIHDIFSKRKYGDIQSFIWDLKDMGYKNVCLIDATGGIFAMKKEVTMYSLRHLQCFMEESDVAHET
mgnify:CR=1 FL=1